MKKLRNTETELKKSAAYQKKRVIESSDDNVRAAKLIFYQLLTISINIHNQ